MFNRVELKNMAKEQIRGKIGSLFLCGLIYFLIVGATGAIPIIGPILSSIASPAFALSFTMIFLLVTEDIKPEIGDIFKGFDNFGKALWLNIITAVFVLLWSLLFIIPGIVKSIAYSMSFYILAENPEMTALEALNESKRITDGHKMDLFILSLSFFWWALLGPLTFGIAYIYVMPYMQTTLANAYKELKQKSTVQ
ncbi:MAG: DUF975 family protein [Acholeplasmataceae bacterium]